MTYTTNILHGQCHGFLNRDHDIYPPSKEDARKSVPTTASSNNVGKTHSHPSSRNQHIAKNHPGRSKTSKETGTKSSRRHDDHRHSSKHYTSDGTHYLDLPIYRRFYCDRAPEVVICTDKDFELGRKRLCIKTDRDAYHHSYGSLYNWSFPKIAYVGSSHVTHLESASTNKRLPQRCRDFLENSAYVGLGVSITWWQASMELNGIFSSKDVSTNMEINGRNLIAHNLRQTYL